MSKIKIDSFVFTEAWQFGEKSVEENERCSYCVMGNKWRDARVYGRVKRRPRER